MRYAALWFSGHAVLPEHALFYGGDAGHCIFNRTDCKARHGAEHDLQCDKSGYVFFMWYFCSVRISGCGTGPGGTFSAGLLVHHIGGLDRSLYGGTKSRGTLARDGDPAAVWGGVRLCRTGVLESQDEHGTAGVMQ